MMSTDGRMGRIPNDDTLVRRLLGPRELEITCEACFAELDRCVELTLTHADPDAEVPGFSAHLRGCPACAEDFASLRALVASDRARET